MRKAGARSDAGRASQRRRTRTLYRALAKRFHPDLASDPSEKPWREQMMTKVNDAYRAQDLAALRQLANARPSRPRRRHRPPPRHACKCWQKSKPKLTGWMSWRSC